MIRTFSSFFDHARSFGVLVLIFNFLFYTADGNEIVQPLTEVSVKLGGQDHTKFVCEVSHIETEVKWYLNQNEIIKERAYSMKQIGHEHILVMSPHERNEGLVTAEAGTVVASTDFIKNGKQYQPMSQVIHTVRNVKTTVIKSSFSRYIFVTINYK